MEGKKGLVKSEIVHHYLSEGDIEEAITWLLYEADEQAHKAVIPLYLQKGEIANAQYYLNQISLHNEENIRYVELQNLHLNLETAGKTVYEIDASQEALIRSIANSPTRVAVHAQAILNQIFGEEFDIDIPDIEGGNHQKRSTASTAAKNLRVNTLSILPNPSKNQSQISWYPLSENTAASLQLYNAMGKKVAEYDVSNGLNRYTLSTNDLPNGIYMCVLVADDTIQQQAKLIVLK